MLLTYLAGVLATAVVTLGQSTTEPCGEVSALLSQGSTAVPAYLAEECLLSAPIVQSDALKIIDGLISMLEWQSTVAWLKNPPSDWPFPAVDLSSDLTQLRGQVSSGNMTSEIMFERSIYTILASAHDGHLYYNMDGMAVFAYHNGWGMIDVVSLDGQAAPGIYLHDDILTYATSNGSEPSEITYINDVNAVDWIIQESQDGAVSFFQDPDALFNFFMYNPTDSKNAGYQLGSFAFTQGIYRGANTTLTFANGTTETQMNYATVTGNFTNVVDGPSFTATFCNATEKMLQLNSSITGIGESNEGSPTKLLKKRTTPVTAPVTAVTQLDQYPAPAIISLDGALSGYFIESETNNTAVMVIRNFPSGATLVPDFAQTLTSFLNLCRSSGKSNLVIDLSNNPGGAVILVYEIFKQLFPSLVPYAAGNFRATNGLFAIGDAITGNAEIVQNADPGNYTAYEEAGAYSGYNARVYLDDSDQPIESWQEFYGPVSAYNDNFTNLFRWDYTNPETTELGQDLVVTGSGNTTLGPQPFEPQNIIIVSDGMCSSSCTSLSHLLKWQGKVKSIAVGGRPQTGPMQQQGGVKGSQVENVENLSKVVGLFMTHQQQASLLNTTSAGLALDGETMILRSQTPTLSSEDISFNIKNNIAENDTTLTPLQFVYEAADCRLWNQASFVLDISNKWVAVANQAFGLNGVTAWSGCVANSTGQPSSLSGNAKLYNNGVPTNVTVQSSSSSGKGSKSKNGAESLVRPRTLMTGLAAVFAILL